MGSTTFGPYSFSLCDQISYLNGNSTFGCPIYKQPFKFKRSIPFPANLMPVNANFTIDIVNGGNQDGKTRELICLTGNLEIQPARSPKPPAGKHCGNGVVGNGICKDTTKW